MGERLALAAVAVLVLSPLFTWASVQGGFARSVLQAEPARILFALGLRLVSLRELSRRAGPSGWPLVLPTVLTPVGIVAMGAARRPLSVTAASWGTLGAGAACALGVFLAVAGSYLAAGQVALGFETGVGPGVWAAIAASVIVIVGGVIAGRPDVSRRTNTAADDAAMAVGPDTPPEQGRSVYPG